MQGTCGVCCLFYYYSPTQLLKSVFGYSVPSPFLLFLNKSKLSPCFVDSWTRFHGFLCFCFVSATTILRKGNMTDAFVFIFKKLCHAVFFKCKLCHFEPRTILYICTFVFSKWARVFWKNTCYFLCWSLGTIQRQCRQNKVNIMIHKSFISFLNRSHNDRTKKGVVGGSKNFTLVSVVSWT